MPLGAARITLLAFQPSVAVEAQVIRKKAGVSAEGNAQVDTAQSKFGGSSLLLDGNNDYLQIAKGNESEYAFGTGDWTLEMWIRPATLSGIDLIFDSRTDAGSVNCPVIYSDGGDLFYRIGATTVITGTTSLTTGSWQHIAVARSSGTTTFYLDGSSIGTYSDSTNYTFPQIRLGHWYSTSAGVDGHIDEFRLSNTARYTANFTPSTTPFVNDADTALLLHMDGTDGSTVFEDDNGVGRARVGVSAVGDAQVDTAYSQFGGASAYLDGTGDYLQAENDFLFGTSDDFTIEFWYKKHTTGVTEQLASNRGGYVSGNWYIQFNSTNDKIQWGVNGAAAQYTTSATFDDTNWHHIALVRNAGNFEFFVDGVSENTLAGPYTFGRAGNYYKFGRIGTADGNVSIDEIRISNTARYTTGFTPSTTPFVNDDNTLLLLHMDGTDGSQDFQDDNGTGRSPVGVSALGDAQVDTAQSKFGGASAYFTTGEDALVTPGIDQTPFVNTWTLEMWFRYESLQNDMVIFENKGVISLAGPSRGTQPNEIILGLASSPVSSQSFYANYSAVSGGWQTGQWYHLAVVHDNGTTEVFLDGTSLGTASTVQYMFTDLIDLHIGKDRTSTNIDFNGWVDELRISSTARYTANFTPSTEPFANDANTLLLLHMDGTDASTTFIDDNGTF